MDTRSNHGILDIWLKGSVTEKTISTITDIIEQNFTVLERHSYKFEPQGDTVIFILSESHFALHTYPEHQYVSIDLYCCNTDIQLEPIFDQILAKIESKRVSKKILHRGDFSQSQYPESPNLSKVG